MKILIINTIAGDTSTGIICDFIASQALQEGNEVVIASSYGSSNIEGVKHWKIGNKGDRILHALMTRIGDSHGFNSTRATASLLEKILQFKPDIIHLNNLHGYYLDIRILINFLKRTSIPIILTLHDCWMLTGHCVNPNYGNCNKYVEGKCNSCPITASYPSSLVDKAARNIAIKKNLLSDFDNLYMVSVSSWLNSIVDNCWISNHPHFIINNGIDTDVFHIMPQVKKERRILGVANVWNEVKGFSDFVKLRELIPADIEILLIGLTPKQIKSLPKGIDGLGKLNSQDLAKEYNKAMLTVSLSHGESFGLTIAESMACGTPVFAYANSSQKEIITSETGLLIPDNDLNAMANAITDFEWEYDKNVCRKYVESHFSKVEMTSKYLELYNALVAR